MHRTSKRGQIDDGGHASEVLENDPTRLKRDLLLTHVLCVVIDEGMDVLLGDGKPIHISQDRLEEDPDGVRQAIDFTNARFSENVQVIDRERPQWCVDSLCCTERIVASHVGPRFPYVEHR